MPGGLLSSVSRDGGLFLGFPAPLWIIGMPLAAWAFFPAFRRAKPLLVFTFCYCEAFVGIASFQAVFELANGRPIVLVGWTTVVAGLLCFLLRCVLPTVAIPSPSRKTLVLIGFLGIGLGIAYLSGPQGGAGRLMAFLVNTLHLSQQSAEAVNFVFRKAVHVTAYGLLALSASAVAKSQGATPHKAVLAGYGWSLVHACYDETYQASVPGRTGQPADVLLDTLGMTLFLLPQLLALRKQAVAE